MKKEVRAFAPASVTNVGCGFDVLGFALEKPGDEVVVRLQNSKDIIIKKISGDEGRLSKDIERNTAGIAVKSFLNETGFEKGIEIELHKKMAFGTGLGSSAASAVAAVVALDHLLQTKLSKRELLKFALEGEKLTSGGKYHADNVAASLYGGLVIVRYGDDPDVVNIDYPEDLHCTIVYPHIIMNTSDMRKLLKKEITLSDAVKQWGNIASLVAGFIKKDYDLISKSINDFIVEPVRSLLIPSFYEMKKAAFDAGSIGCSISGSGPSLFALSRSKTKAKKIANEMKKVLDEIEIEYDIYISQINRKGPKILSTR
jgi:homoserine kinase